MATAKSTDNATVCPRYVLCSSPRTRLRWLVAHMKQIICVHARLSPAESSLHPQPSPLIPVSRGMLSKPVVMELRYRLTVSGEKEIWTGSSGDGGDHAVQSAQPPAGASMAHCRPPRTGCNLGGSSQRLPIKIPGQRSGSLTASARLEPTERCRRMESTVAE